MALNCSKIYYKKDLKFEKEKEEEKNIAAKSNNPALENQIIN